MPTATPNYLPQGERLLEGTIQGNINSTDTSVVVSNPPSSDKLPTYFEFEPKSDNSETVRVYDVNSSTIYFTRGVYSGGVGTPHNSQTTYKEKVTSQHWSKVVDAIQSGYMPEDISITLTRVSASQFKVIGIDRTAYLIKGRVLRFNASDASVAVVSSSSPVGSDTVVDIKSGVTIPNPITSLEVSIAPRGHIKVLEDVTAFLDEDNMASDSATAVPSQQSVKAYADTKTTVKATAAEVATGTEDAKFTTPLAVAPYANSSMSRQAIMNGNFDVWQRGTSVTPADAALTFQADRWFDYINKDSGTLPTLTRSRQLHTSGDITNSFYFSRLATNGAGTSLGVNSQGGYFQRIENATRFLCGNGKKVTVSFWARSSISNKRICPSLQHFYGTGGSPSAAEYILGTPITLTSSWVKYTVTFTTNTLVGKTFGTANDDYLQVNLFYIWGTTLGNSQVQASVTAETFVGSGNIDIAQVQLCAGNVALAFQPKSIGEELRACQRYYVQFGGGAPYQKAGVGSVSTTTSAYVTVPLPAVLRVVPGAGGITVSNVTDWTVAYSSAAQTTAIIYDDYSNNLLVLKCDVASGLTANQACRLQANNTTNARIYISAEL